MKLLRVAALAGALVAPAVASGQAPAKAPDAPADLLERLGASGSIRGGYWSSSRALDDRAHFAGAALWLKAAPKPAPGLSLLVEAWVRDQELFRADAAEGELREAYAEASLGRLDLRVGKQIIVWGRADRINPTDNLTPRDFTLLVPEDDDQRTGTVAARATYFVGDVALTGIWLPHFEPHTIPVRRFPGTSLRADAPGDTLSQWALRIEQTGKAIDWSLSYFQGFDLFPDLAIDRVSSTFVDFILKHHRIRVVGADAATTVGRYGFRAEAAYTFTEDSDGRDPAVKNPLFFLVAGGDRTFLDTLNVNLQYFFRFVVRYASPVDVPDPLQRSLATQEALIANQLDRAQHGATARVSYRWLNETLETETAVVFGFTRLDFIVRPKVTYALTDRWKVVLGADLIRGPRRSFLGNLRENSTAYAELRWSF